MGDCKSNRPLNRTWGGRIGWGQEPVMQWELQDPRAVGMGEERRSGGRIGKIPRSHSQF